MENFVTQFHELVLLYSDFAPLLVFLCIALSSFTLIMSLELLIITGASIGAYFGSFFPFFIACFAGTFFCGQTDYWIGRILGKRLLKFSFMKKRITPEKLEYMQILFKRYGAMTFILGRFIPFGFRLVMFIGAGLFSFNYKNFILADLIAAFIWTSVFYSLFYYFGSYAHLVQEKVPYIVLPIAAVAVILLTIRLIRRRYAISANADLPNKDSADARVSDTEL